MKRKTFLFSLLIALTLPLFAQKQQHRQLDSIFSVMANQNQFNGVVLIADRGKTILKKRMATGTKRGTQVMIRKPHLSWHLVPSSLPLRQLCY